jgi:hypothetical protein
MQVLIIASAAALAMLSSHGQHFSGPEIQVLFVIESRQDVPSPRDLLSNAIPEDRYVPLRPTFAAPSNFPDIRLQQNTVSKEVEIVDVYDGVTPRLLRAEG